MTAITAPRGPRAMALQAQSSSEVLSSEAVFDSAQKKLYPKLALFEALATFEDRHRVRDPSGDDTCEARRDFLDSFAYLCDIDKGGAFVTAAGLQKLPLSSVLWLAANEGIRGDIKHYANILLRKLQAMETGTQESVRKDILQYVVEKCHARITFYKREMQDHARNCRMQLRKEIRDAKVTRLRSKLRKLAEPPASLTLLELVNVCYNARGDDINEIRERSQSAEDDFSMLAHYIGRLGAILSAVNTAVRAMLRVPALHQISEIRFVTTPEVKTVTIDATCPYALVRAICDNDKVRNLVEIKAALHALVDKDIPSRSTVRAQLSSRKVLITRVHAELQLVDKFSRDNLQFVDNDKYIGCSKPACYFCYSWLCNHKHGYVLPATHCKIIPGCRGPDTGINQAGAKILKEMYRKVCGKLDQDILDYLLNSRDGAVRQNHQFMSTEGSSRAQSHVS